MNILANFNWISILLIGFTCFLVANDRAFSGKVRTKFQLALIFCLILSLFNQYTVTDAAGIQIRKIAFGCEEILRPGVVLLLILLSKDWEKKIQMILGIMMGLNVVFVLAGFRMGSLVLLGAYIVLLMVTLLTRNKRGEKADSVFACILAALLLVSGCVEFYKKDGYIFNTALSILTCVYYYYFVMSTYKKDGLTGLLIRHNLNFELEDLSQEDYDIVLIDVDNFKLINDKYGHDKGDEVLVTITDTVRKHLPKGCRMYRFGGDEFVVISRKVSKDTLCQALDHANNSLAKENLHVSYGVVRHPAGVESSVSLAEADKVMYENKRILKSEDIWDDMTGLYNYRGFLDELELFQKVVEKNGHSFCLVSVDIERLNNINMAYGYTEGNMVIQVLSRVLKQCLRGKDFIGHVGSDEFIIAIECQGSQDEYVTFFINQIQEGMDSAYEFSSKDYTIRLNVGKCYVNMDEHIPAEECVNQVLYSKQEDKENRRKNVENEDERDYNNQEEQLVLDILDNNRLRYAFQPIVSAKDGAVMAYEALMRSDTEVMVSPLKIIKYAERNKRTYEVERYSFFNVLSRISEVQLPEHVRIFINSIPGFMLTDLDYDLLKHKYGEWFERMVVEITEQREVDDETLVTLNTRRDKDGFNLAIDDYGSGYSNTNSLLRYMPQIVKLDRLLITGIDRNVKKQFFVNSIISFARENDMLILAEGVETEKELKTLIRLGVDLIQGYITAKPSFEFVNEISAEVKKLIIDENLKVKSNQRMVYTAGSSCELSVVQLAMEDYSKINISGECVKITGSSEYTADMVIRIKDGVDCKLTLSNVCLNSVDDEPCIDIGEGANLTLELEGNNRINLKGIHVPEGSSLTVVGYGNLDILVKGHECYAIGSDTESGFGKILLHNSGEIQINVDGENCVAIGGGLAGGNSAIDILAGVFKVNVAGVDAVAIGCFSGSVPMNLKDFDLYVNFRVNSGIVIGSRDGAQNALIQNFNIEVAGSGTEISGIGSTRETTGTIRLDSGNYKVKLNGQRIYLLGAKGGELDLDVSHTRLNMMGEGDYVLGFGTMDRMAGLSISECSMELIINAASPIGFGIQNKEEVTFGPLSNARINGVICELQAVHTWTEFI